MRRFAVVPLSLILSLLFAGSIAASTPAIFYFEKDCAGAAPYCVIHDAAAPFAILDGAAVWYDGPGLPGVVIRDGRTFLSQEVTIGPSASEAWATGHFRWVGTKGYWTIRNGTGPLAGLHAEGDMAFVGCVGDVCTYALSGRYNIAP